MVTKILEGLATGTLFRNDELISSLAIKKTLQRLIIYHIANTAPMPCQLLLMNGLQAIVELTMCHQSHIQK